ncbi:OB-fold domain-containing protein [Gordonia sp. NPDC003376]
MAGPQLTGTQILAGSPRSAVLAYGGYFPDWRVDPRGTGTATRITAAFDEDAVTMGVAAARTALASGPGGFGVGALTFVTSSPPYLDKTNATSIHAALGCDRTVAASDAIGTARSTMAGLRGALGGVPTLLVAADVRTGLPGSADERAGADAAVAVLLGAPTGGFPALANVLADVSVTEEFLDRWRPPTQVFATTWEERFGFERYRPLIVDATARVLAAAGLECADHVVLTCPNTAVATRARTLVAGARSTCGSPVGFVGAADPLLGLAHALDSAGPDETVLLISACDGVDAMVLRTTAALPARRPPVALADRLGGGQVVPYPTYLSWRGLLDVEMPRRPEPDRPAAPPSARSADWKFGFHGTRCTACGFVHLPPVRVCRGCGAIDEMTALPMASARGTVATFTVDHLAYSPSPPVVDVVVDFDGGGRTTVEVADARPDLLAVGTQVDMVFRRMFTAGGVHNYFWKARQTSPTTDEDI